MVFALSKIVWLFAAPSRVLLLAALVGVFAGARGRRIAQAAIALLVFVCVVPVGAAALASLESTFPPMREGTPIDGVLVIGGALNADVYDSYRGSGFDPAIGRLFEAARLARANPEARVIDIGGPTPPSGPRAEADVAADVLVELGVPRDRIEIERDSRNTYENAVNAANLVKPKPGAKWALITSAFHMPRAVGCFREAGFVVIADPVDYHWLGRGRFFDVVGGLEALDLAVHEYFGLLSYRLMGRTDALWPAAAPPLPNQAADGL